MIHDAVFAKLKFCANVARGFEQATSSLKAAVVGASLSMQRPGNLLKVAYCTVI
jgi:hypothetical protein